MKKLLTISIAAYNVERYLDKLMQSIIDADVMDALEVLIVNDGSKDGTGEKGRLYQNQYPGSVRLIDKENGGHGSTINCGITNATGKYFRALDGDDWVHSAHLGALVRRMDQINADIILSDYCMFYEDGRQQQGDDFTNLMDGRQYSFDEITSKVAWMRYHTVIYRTAILKEHNIHLDEHCFYVDTEFMIFPIPYVQSVYFAKDYIYCYRLGSTEQSVSAESRRRNITNGYTVSEHILQYYIEQKATLTASQRSYFVNGLATHFLWYIQSLMLFPASNEKKAEIVAYEKRIREFAPDCYRQMVKQGKNSRLLKVLRMTHYQAYGLLCLYKKCRRKLEGE